MKTCITCHSRLTVGNAITGVEHYCRTLHGLGPLHSVTGYAQIMTCENMRTTYAPCGPDGNMWKRGEPLLAGPDWKLKESSKERNGL